MVNPTGGGKILFNGSEFPAGCDYPNGAVVNLQAVSSNGYRFDKWTGNVANTTKASTSITMNASETITVYFALLSQGKTQGQVKELLNSNKDIIVVDVSSVSDFNNSHMLCARNYPWNIATKEFDGGISSLNSYKNDDILIYDQNGSRSDDAADYLAGHGFTSIYFMTDGLNDWIAEGNETFMTAEDSGICTTLSPMAYAGVDKTVNENSDVKLNGQGWDPDGGSVIYLWTQIEGANVTLSSRTVAQPTFTAPDLMSGNDELIFHLTVTDNEGDKDSDSVTINVTWMNEAPTADAGQDRTVKADSIVTLDGTESTDPEDAANLLYNWSVSAASGVTAPILSNPSSKKPTFVAPNKDGWIEFRLTVTDNGDMSDSDTVKVFIRQEITNQAPHANAGIDQTANGGALITLDGSDSTDPDDGIKTFTWIQKSGTPLVKLTPKGSQATFTAPIVTKNASLTFELTITDNGGLTDKDTVVIIVKAADNFPPTASAGADQSVTSGDMVTLDGSASMDADGRVTSYDWAQSDSTGIIVPLSSNSAKKPTFTAPVVNNPTTLIFSLIVTDSGGLTSPASTVRVTVDESHDDGGGGGGGGCFISTFNN